MTIESLISSLQLHADSFPEERIACERITLWILEHREFAFVKPNFDGHITASLLITNVERTKILLMFHKKLQLWLQFWWHADGEINVKNVAIREFHEESGISIDPVVSEAIFNVDVHAIPVDKKWTPPHYHYDILFLGNIPEDTPFFPQESEVDDIRWFDIEWIEKYIGEKRMLNMIERIRQL